MVWSAAILPLSWGRRICGSLGRLALRLRGSERRLALDNIARALPHLRRRERESLLRQAAAHLGLNLFQTLAAPRLLRNSHTVIEDFPAGADNRSIGDRLSELAATGRGVFILTGHIGCWELTGGWLAQVMQSRGLGSFGVITGTVHNPAVDRLLQSRRRQMGMHVLPRAAGGVPLVRFLRGGGIVGVLQDQRTQVSNLAVPFFNRPAPTPLGLAALALKYDIPVLPVVGVWDGSRQVHVMSHLPAIRPADFAPHDQMAFLTTCNAALETFIRRNPEQWVWFHRRWDPD